MRTDISIKLDGVLDENAWAKAPRISNFTQRELDENMPATERTEVAVLYSVTDLYIGVWCFDSNPHRIIAQKMSWDFDYGTEDNFEIVLGAGGAGLQSGSRVPEPDELPAILDGMAVQSSSKISPLGQAARNQAH